jgi:putative transposase
MLTASTYHKLPLLHTRSDKEIARQNLHSLVATFGYQLTAWVILNNHYHLLIKSRLGADLTRLVQQLHGKIAHSLNQLSGVTGRHIWQNYWDSFIRSEAGYWRCFNYIHFNPVKHEYVENMDEWEFSSYRYYLDKYGAGWLEDRFQLFPIKDYADARDKF